MQARRQTFSAIGRRLQQIARKLRRNPQAKRVHQFRTTLRRAEAALDSRAAKAAAGKKPAGGKLLRQIKKLRRQAGRVRDVDIQIAALRTVKIGREGDHKAQLMAHLERKRGQREAKFLKGFDRKTVSRLERRLEKLPAAGANGKSRHSPHVRAALGGFAARLQASPDPGPEELHGHRIAGKKLRYLLELLPEEAGVAELIAQLRRMQDAIGDWHDWGTLARTAEKTLSHSPRSALLNSLQSVTESKYAEAVRVCQQLQRQWAAPGQQLLARKKPAGSAARAKKPEQATSAKAGAA